MTSIDSLRLETLQKKMAAAGLDALVCRLPENISYLTETWPVHGVSFAVFPQSRTARLFAPACEVEFSPPGWAEVTAFPWGHLDEPELYDSYRRLLVEVRQNLGLTGARIGIELGFEIAAPSFRAAEAALPAKPWFDLLEETLAGCELTDCRDFLAEVRAIKTPFEIDKLRIVNEIAELGITSAIQNLRPGMSEIEVSAAIEAKIRVAGTGYRGARMVRAFSEVVSGPEGTLKGTMLIPSSNRKLEEGDLVMIEQATVADGYFSDLTYTAVVGKPSTRQAEIYNAVLAAQQAAAQALRPGACSGDIDQAARRSLEAAGLGRYFVHGSGHGVGRRYHESIPALVPGSREVLREGMVTSVEPGVYIAGFGGVRIEDNVAVGKDGPVFLSTPREEW